MVEGFARKAIGEKVEELQRSYRYNHSCSANAFHTIDHEFNASFIYQLLTLQVTILSNFILQVMVGYTKRDIQAGEEICINYFGFNESYDNEFQYNNSFKRAESFDDIRTMLQLEHRIVCPPNCLCRDPEIEQIVMEGKKKFRNLKIVKKSKKKSTTYSVVDADEDLRNIQQLLKHSEKIQVAPTDKARLLALASTVAMQRKSTFSLGKMYAKGQCCDLVND